MTKRRSKTSESKNDAKPKETKVEFLASLAGVLATGLFIIAFMVQAFAIPSSSMENTLLVGDHVFVNRIQNAPRTKWIEPLLPYRDPKFQDIVVFLHPDPAQAGTYVVKRIIGVPGDHIHLRNGVVYRNGVALNEPYIDHDADTFDPYRNEFPSVPPTDDGNMSANWLVDLPSFIKGDDIVVPPDHYFAMGDHRSVSLDSRFWGFIPKRNVIGKPMFIYWSFEASEEQYKGTSLSDRVGFLAHSIIHFFDETRWRRTLRVVR